MNFEEALIQELQIIVSLNSRIYPLFSPKALPKYGVPYLAYRSSEGLKDNSLAGYQSSKNVDGELNIVSPNYEQMKQVTREVIAILISTTQRVIGTDGPYIQEMTYERPVELYEEAPKLYRCSIAFNFYFNDEE